MRSPSFALELRVFWCNTLLAVKHLQRTVTLGEARGADIFASSDALPLPLFPLVTHDNGAFSLTVCEALSGQIQREDGVFALSDAPWAQPHETLAECLSIALQPKTYVVLHCSGLTIAMRVVVAPERVLGPREWDWPFLNLLCVSVFVMAAAIVTLGLYPFEVERSDEMWAATDQRFIKYIMEKPKERAQEAAVGDAPTAAAPGLPPKPRRPAPSHVPAATNVRDLGVLHALSAPGGAFAQILGNAGPMSAAAEQTVAGLTAKMAGGIGGLDVRGSISDAPGTTLGLGHGIATLDAAGGARDYGHARGDIGSKRETEIAVADAPPVIRGALDPQLIKRVIQENRNAIRYCYERELQIHKALGGTLRMQFVIGAEGSVTTAVVKESTLANAAVEGCVAGKLRSLVFPKPQGGGVVLVNYPFVFTSGN